jgi:hypothetical protein
MRGASRMTKARLWLHLSDRGERSGFPPQQLAGKGREIRTLRQLSKARQLGRGDSPPIFLVARFAKERPTVGCQNHWLPPRVTKAGSDGIEPHRAPQEWLIQDPRAKGAPRVPSRERRSLLCEARSQSNLLFEQHQGEHQATFVQGKNEKTRALDEPGAGNIQQKMLVRRKNERSGLFLSFSISCSPITTLSFDQLC